MKGFGWRTSPTENSPARSQLSSNSGFSLKSSNTATKSREQSPARLAADATGGGGGGGGGAVVAVSNRKMLKIGANVRFRGDVMECNTVVLYGRLQVRLFFLGALFLMCPWEQEERNWSP